MTELFRLVNGILTSMLEFGNGLYEFLTTKVNIPLKGEFYLYDLLFGLGISIIITITSVKFVNVLS